MSPMGWTTLLAGSLLLVVVGLIEIAFFLFAPWPAMRETEAEYGFPTQNETLIFPLMLGRPALAVAVGAGAATASLLQLTS